MSKQQPSTVQEANQIMFRALTEISTTQAFFSGERHLVAIAREALLDTMDLFADPPTTPPPPSLSIASSTVSPTRDR